MARTRLAARVSALAVGGSLLLAGCSEAGDPDPSDPTGATATDGSTASSDASSSSAPTNQVTADRAGVRFDLPPGWTAVDIDEVVRSGESGQALEDFAREQGMDPDDFVDRLSGQVDVLALGPERGSGSGTGSPDSTDRTDSSDRTDSLSVIRSPMPTETELRSQISTDTITLDSVDRLETAEGPGWDAAYRLTSGSTAGRVLVVPSDTGAALITITTSTPAEAEAVRDAVLESLTSG